MTDITTIVLSGKSVKDSSSSPIAIQQFSSSPQFSSTGNAFLFTGSGLDFSAFPFGARA